MAGLSSRQKTFVVNYIVSGNAAEAARESGYSLKASREAGFQLLQRPAVAAEVKRVQDKLERESVVDAKYVIRNLKATVERCMPAEGTFDSAGANKALESLGRMLGLFVDKHEIGGEVTHTHKHSVAELPPKEQHAAARDLIGRLRALGIGEDDDVSRN